jgi:hypothetical protein
MIADMDLRRIPLAAAADLAGVALVVEVAVVASSLLLT